MLLENLNFLPAALQRFKFLEKVVSMATALINTKDPSGCYLFLKKILVPVVIQVLHQGGSKEINKDECYNWCLQLFDYHHLLITMDNCQPSSPARSEISASNRGTIDAQIVFNSSWVVSAEITCDSTFHIEDYYDREAIWMNAHLALGIVKFVNGLVRTFTSAILQLERKVSNKKVMFVSPPVMVGTKLLTNNRPVGDLGYAGEQLLFGHSLRMDMEYETMTWKLDSIYFRRLVLADQEELVEEHSQHNKFQRKGKGNPKEKHAIKTESSRNSSGRKTTITLQKQPKTIAMFSNLMFAPGDDELNYLAKVRQVFEDYLAGRATDGNKLFEVWMIEDLNLFKEEEKILISVKDFGRGYCVVEDEQETTLDPVPEPLLIPLTNAYGQPAKE